jgi:tetratricopeptide (TPR) repeat protein
MSKSKSAKTTAKSATSEVNANSSSWWSLEKNHYWMIGILGFLLYANTLFHDFTIDDAIVITDNMFTTKGISGIPGILQYDTFYGFFKEAGKANLVAGGRYRPFTLVMFAMEYQLFGNTPFFGHLINVCLYILTGIVLYKLLKLFFRDYANEQSDLLALLTAILFVAHPIHVEAVANIKGRDEIMALLCSLLATYYLFKYEENAQQKHLWYAAGLFFIALLSKENSITFLGIIPLSFYCFRKVNLTKQMTVMVPIVAATVLFLLIRTAVIGAQTGSAPLELMNNPFLKLEGGKYIPFSFNEKMATIFFTLGKYLQLLVVPHPLTHDYYPRHIEIMSFGELSSLLSLLAYIGLLIYGIFLTIKKHIVGYGILFYLLSLSIVSNLIFPIGTNMSERFLFMPSVGFCLAAAWLLTKLSRTATYAVATIFVLGFSYKTTTRNMVWKDNFTLFTTDILVSKNSAKLCNAVGGDLIRVYSEVKDPALKKQKITEAITYLKRAIEIHPIYKNAYLLMGNGYYYLGEYALSVAAYQDALKIDPQYKDALNNLPISLRDLGRQYGEVKNDLEQSIFFLTEAYKLKNDDVETIRLLGVANGIKGNHQDAAKYFKRLTELEPNNARAWLDLGTATMSLGDQVNGVNYHKKAQQIDPNILKSTVK